MQDPGAPGDGMAYVAIGIRNYRPHPIKSQVWRCVDIDPALRPK